MTTLNSRLMGTPLDEPNISPLILSEDFFTGKLPGVLEANGWPVGPECERMGRSLPGLRPSLGERLGLRPERRIADEMPTLRATQAGCLHYEIHFAAGQLPSKIA